MAGGPEVMLKVMFPALKLNRRNPTKTLTALAPMLIFLLGGEKLDGTGAGSCCLCRQASENADSSGSSIPQFALTHNFMNYQRHWALLGPNDDVCRASGV